MTQAIKFFQVPNLPAIEEREARSFYFVETGVDDEITEVYLIGRDGVTRRFGTTEIVSPDVEWSDVTGKPATFTPSAHNHDDRYFTQTAMTTALASKADLVNGVLATAQVPAIAIVQFLGSVANQAAMLALTGQRGDWCIRSDQSKVFVLTADNPSVLGNWQAFEYPTGSAAVNSVNGQTGIVVLSKSDINLGNVPNVDATNRANHTGTQDASTITGTKTATFISNFVAALLAATLTGLTTATNAAITAGDSLLVAFGKLQAQITSLFSVKADKAVVPRTFDGTADTLSAADVGKEIRASSGSAKAVTIPATATLGTDFICAIYNYGAGALTFTPAGGVTLRGNSGSLAQYKTATIRAVGANEYQITGEMV